MALRHKRRQQREREERKREKKITEEQNKRMGKYPRPNVHIDSQRHFPEWQPEVLFAEYVCCLHCSIEIHRDDVNK